MSGKLLTLVDSAMQPNEPGNQSAPGSAAVGGLVIVNQLTLIPSRNNPFEFELEVCLGLWVGQFACQGAVEVINGAEVVAILARNDGELVVRMSRVWVDFGGQTIVSFGRAPVALLVLVDELCLTIAGEVA